jgi:hypothetical protein
MGSANRLRISNDLFMGLFVLTLTPAAISGMLAAAMLYLAHSSGNRQWLQTDVSDELRIFGIAGGLAAALLALRLFAPITWVDLRENRRSGGPSLFDGGPSLPNSERESEFESGMDVGARGGSPFSFVGLALLLLVLLVFRSGSRFTPRGLTLWGWEFGFFHLFGRDWTGIELGFMALLLGLLAAICRSGWRRERDLNR